jgi:hypothetical protein
LGGGNRRFTVERAIWTTTGKDFEPNTRFAWIDLDGGGLRLQYVGDYFDSAGGGNYYGGSWVMRVDSLPPGYCNNRCGGRGGDLRCDWDLPIEAGSGDLGFYKEYYLADSRTDMNNTCTLICDPVIPDCSYTPTNSKWSWSDMVWGRSTLEEYCLYDSEWGGPTVRHLQRASNGSHVYISVLDTSYSWGFWNYSDTGGVAPCNAFTISGFGMLNNAAVGLTQTGIFCNETISTTTPASPPAGYWSVNEILTCNKSCYCKQSFVGNTDCSGSPIWSFYNCSTDTYVVNECVIDGSDSYMLTVSEIADCVSCVCLA